MRYLVPVIPLCIFIAALALARLTRRSPWLAAAAGAVVFGTNLVHGGPLTSIGARSSIALYARELLDPAVDPYQVTAAWINANVRAGESIWVMPAYMKYPLMFHAPKAVYAWQLAWPPEPQFEGLPAIHFEGRVQPDYMIAFGPAVGTMVDAGFTRDREQLATLDVYWKDLYRPELSWRRFGPVTGYDRGTEAVYVFGRPPAAAPAVSP